MVFGFPLEVGQVPLLTTKLRYQNAQIIISNVNPQQLTLRKVDIQTKTTFENFNIIKKFLQSFYVKSGEQERIINKLKVT